jgi:hypothetical protein
MFYMSSYYRFRTLIDYLHFGAFTEDVSVCVQASSSFTYMSTGAIYIVSIEPGWLSVRRGQRLMITAANLKENDSPRVRVQGQLCRCNVLSVKGNLWNVVCTTPELNPNSSTVIVELATGSTINQKTVSLLRPLMRLYFVGSTNSQSISQVETLNQLSLKHLDNTPLYISPLREKISLSSQDSAVSFEYVVYFDVLYPGEIFNSPSEFDLELKANNLNKCPKEYAASCASFISQAIDVFNITIEVSTQNFLRARGTVSIPQCPSVFCGSGGRGLLLDGNFSIKQGNYVELSAMLSIVPKFSQPAVSVRPAVVPAGRSFSIVVHVQRFSAFEIHGSFQCDFADANGKVSNGLVGDVKQDESGDLLEILVLVPVLTVGPISGRIYSQEPSVYRTQTINTFNIISATDPPGPGLVDWISASEGPCTGALVQAHLIGFPMMNSAADVRIFPIHRYV